MEEHSDHTLSLQLKDYYHKVDGPNQGQTYTSPQSGRTPPMVNTCPQNGRIQPGSNLCRSTKWTDSTRVELIQVHKVDEPHQGSKLTHKVDGPNQGQTYTSPQSGRTPPMVNTSPQRGRTTPRLKTTINIMDGLNQSQNYKSTKWTAINGHDHIPRNERTQPGS